MLRSDPVGGSSGELGRVDGPDDDGDREADEAPDVRDTLEGRRSKVEEKKKTTKIHERSYFFACPFKVISNL